MLGQHAWWPLGQGCFRRRFRWPLYRRFCLHGFSQPNRRLNTVSQPTVGSLRVRRADCEHGSVPLYTRDLRFWPVWVVAGSWNRCPLDYEGGV